MGGVMRSGYTCTREEWTNFVNALRSTSFWIEQKGDMEEGLFLDVKSREGGPHGVWVGTYRRETSDDNEEVKLAIDWIAKNPGKERYASREIAAEVEKLLLAAGATCTYCPVSEFIARH